MNSMPEAVFLDRDGVINEEVDYPKEPKDLRLIEGVPAAIRRLNGRKIPVIVITNQSGVALGFYSEPQVELLHESLAKELKKDGAHIDRFYYCPHHPNGKGRYAITCDCRKPMPGLLHQAARDFNINLSRCVVVGDKAKDIQAGESVGARTILVMTGYGSKEISAWKESFQPTFVAPDLPGAVEWLLNGSEKQI